MTQTLPPSAPGSQLAVTGAVAERTEPGRGRAALDDSRHDHGHEAQPDRVHPDPRGALLLEHSADHVRPALPVRLRRGDPCAGVLVRRLHDAGDLRADGFVRRDDNGSRNSRGPPEGADRAVQGAPDGAIGGTCRTDHGGSHPGMWASSASLPPSAMRSGSGSRRTSSSTSAAHC